MKRDFSFNAIIVTLMLMLSACSTGVATINPSIPTSDTIIVETTPTQENLWVPTILLDQDSSFSLSNSSVDGYNGWPVEGSMLIFNKDTRWDVSIKVAENSMSTGLVIEGTENDFYLKPNIFLGYSEGFWRIGYGFNGNYSFFKTINIDGLEASLQMIISTDGRLLEVKNGDQILFSTKFDTPIFGIGTEVTTYVLCGPRSSLEISNLSISKNENQQAYESVAQSAPDYPTTPAPAIPAVSGPITVEKASQLTRLVTLGEGDLINVQLSPDGKYVLLGSSTGILVLDSTTLKKVSFLQSSMNPEKIYFFDDGSKVAALDRYNIRGHVWSFPDGEEIREVKIACPLDPIRKNDWYYSWPSQNLEYAFSYYEGIAGLCQAADGVPVYTLEYQMDGYPAFSIDERLLALPTADKLVLIQYRDGKVLTEIPAVGIKSIFFSPDGKTLAAVFSNQTKFWSTEDYQLIDTDNGVVNIPIFSPDQSVFATQNGDYYRLNRTADREYFSSVKGVTLQFTRDSEGIIVDRGSGQVAYYEINEDRNGLTLVNSVAGTGYKYWTTQSPGFLSDNKQSLLVAKPEGLGGWLTELRVYDLLTGERSIFEIKKMPGTWFQDAVWLENLNQFAVILGSPFDLHRFFTLEPDTGKMTQVIDDIKDAQQSRIRFTSNSDMLAFARGETVTIWDIKNNIYGNPDEGINGYTKFFDETNKSASPNGSYIISIREEENPGFRNYIRVSINNEMIESYTGFSNLDYAFSPDSTMLAISTFSILRGINVSVFDLATQEKLFFSGDYFAEGEIAPKIAFSPDGKYLAILPETGYPQIWGVP